MCRRRSLYAPSGTLTKSDSNSLQSSLTARRCSVEIVPFRQAELPEIARAALPEKDRPVLAAAIRLRCDALVTGDRTHFGKLYGVTIEGVAIHSPQSLAEAALD